MPSPSVSLVTLRPELEESLEEFDTAADRLGFIGAKVLPVKEVKTAKGNFGLIPIEEKLRNDDKMLRAARAGYSRGDYKFEQASWETFEYGHEEVVDEKEEALYEGYFDLEVESAEIARDKVLRGQEIRIAAAVFDNTVFTTTAVGTEWSDLANAKPVDDVRAARIRAYAASGIWPDTLIFDEIVRLNLIENVQVRDRIMSVGAGDPTKATDVTNAMLAAVFALPNIIVSQSTQNTANQGQAAVLSQIWDDEFAMITRTAKTDSVKTPAIGRSFHWGGDGSTFGGTVESYEEPQTRADIIRVRHQVGEEILFTNGSQLLENITA